MSDYRYRMVNGELVPLTADEIAALEELERNPQPPLPMPFDHGARANMRLDAGISAAQPAMDDATNAQNRAKKARTTEDELAALQAQVDALILAMSNMLIAQTGPTPRSN